MELKKNYSLEDILNLYEKILLPITKDKTYRYESQKGRFISYVENICTAMDLSYNTKEENVYFGNDVYSIIEKFYLNQASFLTSEDHFVTFKEALDIFDNNISDSSYLKRVKMDEELSELNIKRRDNWKRFIETLPIQFFLKNKFYFLKSDIVSFKEKIITAKSLQDLYSDKYNRNVSLDRLRRFIKEKIGNEDIIKYLGAEFFYPLDLVEKFEEQFPYNLSDFYNVQEVSEILGVRRNYLIKCVREKDCFPGASKEGFLYQFPIKEVENWRLFLEENTDLFEFVAGLLKEKKVKVKTPFSDDFYVVRFINSLLDNKVEANINFINGETTPFPNVKRFLNQRDFQKVTALFEQHWSAKELFREQGKLGKFKSESQKIINPYAPTTMKEFYDFAINRISNVKGITSTMMLALYKALSQINKELIKHNDTEVKELLNVVKQTTTNKVSIQDFCMFITYMQKKYETNYINTYHFNKHEVIENKKDVTAYTEEQYFRFGFLLINDTHEWYSEFLEKAVRKRVFASLWLYGLMHYVCAWRGKDMIKKLPTPRLPVDPDEFIRLVREEKLTAQMAYQLVDEVELKIRYLKLKPTKTEGKNPPGLVLEIPESIKYRFGMLLGLCEAHRQRVNGNTLIVFDIKSKDNQFEFFGEEFLQIFHGEGFNNIRATKTFETLIANRADKEKIGSGYIIASLSRSHKCSFDQKSNTTAIYLNEYRQLTDGDILIRELFERGVCSFVPYLMLKTIEGIEDVKKMTISEQTTKMKKLISFHPYDVEMLIRLSDDVLEKVKREAMLLIREFGYKENSSDSEREISKKVIYKFINRIACGTAPAKENNINCISVAKGNGCIFPSRETCIGCGQEIYLKSSFFVIGQRMRELTEKEENSKTNSEKIKYRMLIEHIFKPVLTEMVLALRDIYGIEDVSEYREIVFGIAEPVTEDK